MQCFIYARVSTERQADKDLSIPAQLRAMRSYALDRGWGVAEEFIESGASGRTVDRPALRALLAACRQDGRRAGVVLAHKIDRLARNLADHLALKALLRERGIALASVVENLDDSNAGQLVEHIMASLAEFYSANLSDEIKKGMRQKVLGGGWPHVPPRGYRLAPLPSGVGRVVEVDPQTAPLVRLAFQRCGAMEPEGMASLARMLARHGLVNGNGEPLSPWTMVSMLRNPFYAGKVRWGKETHRGQHDPIVSEQLFLRVRQVIARRSRRSLRRKHHVLLRGFAACARCGRGMTAQTDPRHLYYRCLSAGSPKPCKSSYARGDLVHAQLREIYAALPVPGTARDELRVAVRQDAIAAAHEREQWRTALRAELADISSREATLADRLSGRLIEPDTYSLAADVLLRERDRIEQKLAATPGVEQPDADLRAAVTVWDLHGMLAPAMQDRLLRMVFRSVRLSRRGIERYVLTAPFRALFRARRESLPKVA